MKLYTLAQASQLSGVGVTVRRLQQLCAEGRCGHKIGNTWVLTQEDIKWLKRKRPAGRPKQ